MSGPLPEFLRGFSYAAAGMIHDHVGEELEEATVPEDDLARPGRKPTRDEIAAVLIAEGAEPGNSIHSWRCEYPAHYGPCDCVARLADALIDLYDRAAKGEL